MKEGMGWVFKGNFFGPLQCTSWKDRFSSQANPKAMEESQLDIVIAALYAHPLFVWSLKDSIRKQLQLVERFVHENPKWIVAKNPLEAKRALMTGKKVLILALEGASGILETEEDLKEFIDKGGIRIVTLLHLTDDELGGVAFLNGLKILSSPIALLRSFLDPIHDPNGVKLNSRGLTKMGRSLALKLIQRKVWIDLSHASDQSQIELYPILMEAKQPIFYTHTVLRNYLGAERGLSIEQLKKVATTHGLIGLIPSSEMLKGTPAVGKCNGSISYLAHQFQEVAQYLDEASIGIGSDFNGGITHLEPNCSTHTSIDQQGLWQIGQSQDIWTALENLGVWHPKNKNNNHDHSERFLKTWSALWNH